MTVWFEPAGQEEALVGEVIWGVITSSCCGWIGELEVATAMASRETRVLKIMVVKREGIKRMFERKALSRIQKMCR